MTTCFPAARLPALYLIPNPPLFLIFALFSLAKAQLCSVPSEFQPLETLQKCNPPNRTFL